MTDSWTHVWSNVLLYALVILLFSCENCAYMLNNVKYDIFEQAQHRMHGLTVMVP
jgi:hypothetical protein